MTHHLITYALECSISGEVKYGYAVTNDLHKETLRLLRWDYHVVNVLPITEDVTIADGPGGTNET